MEQVVAGFHLWRTSVVRKQFMALTGLMMCGFLVIHLAGNLLIFKSPEIFNQYAFFMLNNPIVMALEWLLALLFILHAAMGLFLMIDNMGARPQRYHVRQTSRKGSTISFLTMSWTGPLTLIFLVAHLFHFKYGTQYTVFQGGIEIRDLYRTILEYFADPFNVLLYSLAMLFVALHVQHGFWSAFQSFGFNHPRYNRLIEIAANLYALLVFIGFIAIPLSFIRI